MSTDTPPPVAGAAFPGADDPMMAAIAEAMAQQNGGVPPAGIVPDVPPAGADAATGPAAKGKNAKLIADLAGMYGTVGIILMPFNQADGLIILSGAIDRATELVRVAEKHPPMMKVLRQIVVSNAYIALAVGHGSMLYAIAANHKMVPPSLASIFTGAQQADAAVAAGAFGAVPGASPAAAPAGPVNPAMLGRQAA